MPVLPSLQNWTLPGPRGPALWRLEPRWPSSWPVSGAESGLARPAPRSHSGGRETVRCLGTICLPALVERTALLSVIVTICFPPSCLLMFSCFKTEMSQIGSRFRKKCLGGKLQVAMGDSVFQSHWRKKRFWRQAGPFASISCPVGPESALQPGQEGPWGLAPGWEGTAVGVLWK